MLKKHQRWTALLVAFAVLGLLLDFALPIAASTPEKSYPAEESVLAKQDNSEKALTLESDLSAPRLVEQVGSDWNRTGKKSTWSIAILGFAAIAIVLLIKNLIDTFSH